VVDQFKGFLRYFNQEGTSPRVRGHINVSGGEPFLRSDFLDLLEVFADNSDWFSFAILTNGSLIDAAMARRLRALRPTFVQVSIEGAEPTNDAIRGAGTFKKTVSALQYLVKEGVATTISFTAHRDNYREFLDVARLGRQISVNQVWADRVIPWGSGSSLADQILSPALTKEFFEIMYNARSEIAQTFSQTQILMFRALQFLVGGGRPYRCQAGNTLITLQPNGDVYPCRRMPIHVGNVVDTPLIDLYFNSDLFVALRNPDQISDGCEDCAFSSQCRGGLRCLSYALTGDPFKADPGCWRSTISKSATNVGGRPMSPSLSAAGSTQ
jgi:radical SAM protein with 4Fe4S-binding SPASM domain